MSEQTQAARYPQTVTEDAAERANPHRVVASSELTSRLTSLQALPVAEHADVYQAVHADLQAALAAIDGR